MNTAVNILLALLLASAGMAALSLAMHRHHRQIRGTLPPPALRHTLRWSGGSLLTLALVPCLSEWDAGVGIVSWLGFLSAGALIVVAVLACLPRQHGSRSDE